MDEVRPGLGRHKDRTGGRDYNDRTGARDRADLGQDEVRSVA